MNKLTNKLILYIILIVSLGMLSLTAFNTLKVKRILEGKTIEEQYNQINIYSKAITNNIQLLKDDLFFLANAPGITQGHFLTSNPIKTQKDLDNPKHNIVAAMLKDMVQIKPFIKRIDLIDLKTGNGTIRMFKNSEDKILLDDSPPSTPAFDPFEKVKKLNRGQINISKFSNFDQMTLLSAQTPIISKRGEKIGVFSITMDFSKILSSLKLDMKLYDYFIYNTEAQLLSTNFDKNQVNAFKRIQQINKVFKEPKNRVVDSDYLYLKQPIYYSRYNPDQFLQVLLVTSRSSLNTFIKEEVLEDFLIFAVILAASLVLSIFYIKDITKPLRILKDLSGRINKNKNPNTFLTLDELEIETLGSDHEITQLTKGLVMMSKQIVSQNKHLELQQKALDLVSLVAITDKDGVISNVNQKFCDAAGYTKSELLGTQLKFLNTNLHSEHFIERLKSTIRSGQIWTGEIKNKSKNGDLYWTHTSIVPLMDDDHNIVKVITMGTDTTEQKKKDAELKELAKTKERFLATMSHEIRTPLNAIIGMLSLLEDEQFSAEGEKNLSILKSNSKSLLVLINDILDLSKIQSGKIQLEHIPVSLQNIVKETIELFKGNCEEKNITIKFDQDFTYPPILSDETRIRQVLSNLISNAIKFSNQNDIRINQNVIKLNDNKLLVEIDIIDKGIGIEKDNIKHLFQSFTQADNSTSRTYGGTGLGLSISKEIAGALGGDITVLSEIGKGSTFSFTFIVEENIHLNLKPVQANQGSFPIEILKTLSVLVVDDNEINRNIASKFLLKMGIESEQACDGMIAVEKAKAKRYDIIFMDSHMPNLDGIGATKRMRSELSYHPWIIAFTAATNEKEQCLAAGMDDFVAKPISKKQLNTAFENYFSTHDKKLKAS